MRVLVTGANGFVGKSLCKRLLAENVDVTAATRSPLAIQPHPKLTQFLTGDLGEHTEWGKALEGIDVVIHLAARVHLMQDTAADPLAEFIKINCDATVNLARRAAAAGVQRFVYLSSIKVNGEMATADAPFNEMDVPSPQDPYAISKFRAEEALKEISSNSNMGIVIVRPPLVYGPGVKANFFKLLKLANRSIPLPLGKVENKRSMIFLENLSDALLCCSIHPAAVNQTYLISDGEDVSTGTLFLSLAKALHRSVFLLPVPLGLMRLAGRVVGKSAAIDRLTQSLVVDSSKIRRELGWAPPYTLNAGLQITADWYRSEFGR